MSRTYTMTPEQFLAEVKDHKLTVIHEHGVHRHPRFQEPGTMCMHFDLITWPGYLCYTGDMGTYVFTRLRDMFEFFRRPKDRELFQWIDRRYWAEKVEAADKHDGLKEFSPEKFKRAVMTDLVNWIRNCRDDTSPEERRALWDEVVDRVIEIDDDMNGTRSQAAANDFSLHINAEVGDFYFQDFWDHNVEEWTHRFEWCCHALRWGIEQYDIALVELCETAQATVPVEQPA
jgi:hypothetical protein